MPITVPAKLDFTLATLNLRGSTIGLRLAAEAPRGTYFAAADERDRPRQVLILLVNREPTGSTAPVATPVRVRVQTRVAEPPPAFSQHINILANGALGQDCSSLTYFPPNPPLTTSVGVRVLWGYKLRALASSGSASKKQSHMHLTKHVRAARIRSSGVGYVRNPLSLTRDDFRQSFRQTLVVDAAR